MGPSTERLILDLVAAVQGVLDLRELLPVMLQSLSEAVPCDWASLNDIGASLSEASFVALPAVPPELLDVFRRHGDQNPLLQRWLRTQDGRAYRFSDVASETALSQLELFRDFYQPLGIRFQIAFTLPSSPERLLAVALSRRHHDFSDGERDLLNDARPFLIQAYRNAVAHEALQTAAAPGGAVLDELVRRGLTPREAEVLGWLATGRARASVAEQLGVSPRTVQKHLERAYRKLGVVNRSEAASLVWALSERV